MDRLKDFLYKKADLKHLFFSGAVFTIFNILIFPFLQRRIDPSGEHPMLDLLFGYSQEEAYYILDAIGEEGRSAYFFTTSIADMLYPIVYSLFLSIIIILILKKMMIADGLLSYLAFSPFLIMIFDFIENSAIIIMLSSFPQLTEWAVMTGSYAGMAKWVSTAAVLVIIVFLLIRIFTRKFFNAE